jgi:predicted metal-binding membrane protein
MRADTPLEILLKRDRIVVLAALTGLVAVSWIYLIFDTMRMSDPAGAMMQVRSWTLLDAELTLAMWIIMMVGMMVPGAAPTILLYGLVTRKQSRRGHVLAPTGVFVTGYLIAWSVFSVLATALQWLMEHVTLLTPMVTLDSALAAGALMVATGVYQLTPTKRACLEHCRSPAEFLSRHWRKGFDGAIVMGLHHGAYCLGCCWGLMALLFVGGVMNLLWVAALAAFVLIEKLTPFGYAAARGTGLILLLCGSFIALQGVGA